MVDRRVGEVDMVKDEGLADIVVGQVPEGLGGKGHLIDSLEAEVALADNMLLHQLHALSACLSNGSRLACGPSRFHSAHLGRIAQAIISRGGSSKDIRARPFVALLVTRD